MGRGYLKEEEIQELKKNPYVLDADNTRVLYTSDFKKHFIDEYKKGKKPVEIFRNAGFDVKMLGSKRIERASARWRETYNSGGADAFDSYNQKKAIRTKRTKLLQDVEKYSSDLALAEFSKKESRKEIEYLNHEIERLRTLANRLYAENRELKDQIAQAEINGNTFDTYKSRLYSVM